MKLYHYMPLHNYSALLQSSGITPGDVAMPNGKLGLKHAVSLTKSEQPNLTGIPTGKRLPDDVFQRLQELGSPWDAHKLIGGIAHQRDHSAVRFRVDIPPGPHLVSAREFYKTNPKILGGLAVAAASPYGTAHMTESELDKHIDHSASKIGKIAKEWWYYVGTIPLSFIDEVCMRQPQGFYISVSLPAELVHARQH